MEDEGGKKRDECKKNKVRFEDSASWILYRKVNLLPVKLQKC